MAEWHRRAGSIGQAAAKTNLRAYLDRRHQAALRKWQERKVVCAHCGRNIPYEKRSNKFCSHHCSAAETNRRRASRGRLCTVCGKPLKRGCKTGCSTQCRNELRYRTQLHRWWNMEISGGYWCGVAKFVHRWLRTTYGERCWLCGWAEINVYTGKIPLQVHHKDDNPYNHSPENLELLCPNCHALTKSYSKQKKGNGRTERYKNKQPSTPETALGTPPDSTD